MRNERGITLIALVITIIILIILTFVTVVPIFSDNNIFDNAKLAKNSMGEAQYEELVSSLIRQKNMNDYIGVKANFI